MHINDTLKNEKIPLFVEYSKDKNLRELLLNIFVDEVNNVFNLQEKYNCDKITTNI